MHIIKPAHIGLYPFMKVLSRICSIANVNAHICFYYRLFTNKNDTINSTLLSNKPPFGSDDDTIICIESILFEINSENPSKKW